MNGLEAQIDFNQRIQLEWFEKTANLILAGNDKTAVNDSLQKILKKQGLSGGQDVRAIEKR